MKFAIRELLLVTVIVALTLGWGLDHWRLARVHPYFRVKTKDPFPGNPRGRVVLAQPLLDSSAPVPNPPKP